MEKRSTENGNLVFYKDYSYQEISIKLNLIFLYLLKLPKIVFVDSECSKEAIGFNMSYSSKRYIYSILYTKHINYRKIAPTYTHIIRV